MQLRIYEPEARQRDTNHDEANFITEAAMNKKEDWKHGAYIPTDEKVEHIAIFDDEDPECDSIYRQYVGGRLSPCRTVFRANREHWSAVLLAWAGDAPLLDRRNNRETPLP